MQPEDKARPHASWAAAVGHEILSGLLFNPLIVGCIGGALRWQAWMTWLGSTTWRRARASAPALPPRPPRSPARIRNLFFLTLAGHFAAFTVVLNLLGFGICFLLEPLIPELTGHVLSLFELSPTPHAGWLFPALGSTMLVLGCVALAALGRLRFHIMADLATAEHDELTAQVAALSLSRATLVDAFEAERRRIERDLHDGAQQRLVGLAMTLGMTARNAHMLSADDQRVRPIADALSASQDEIEKALSELRTTVRGIHPQVLSDHGLFAALRELASRPGLRIELRLEGDDTLVSEPIASGCWFGVTEAVTNAGKHAHADAVTVTVQVTDRVRAEVVDDGRGGARLDDPTATGLRGLAERMSTLGGTMVLHSPPGEGTRVVLDLPLVPSWTEEG